METSSGNPNSSSEANTLIFDLNSLQDYVVQIIGEYLNEFRQISYAAYFYFFILILLMGFVAYPFTAYCVRSLKCLAHPMMFSYKHVVITGVSSQGLGKALVQEIFMKGAYITIIGGRNDEKLKKIAQSIDVNHKNIQLISYIATDITELKTNEIESILKYTENKYGPIEMVVCCAAMSKPGLFLSSNPDHFMHHMDLNFQGTLRIVHPIIKRMVQRKTQGRVVLVGDQLQSYYAIPGMAPYACSKAALEQFAYQLKSELDAHEIKIHYFIPPPMDSKLMQEQRKMYPLITRMLLSKLQTCSPDKAANILMRGIQMNQFFISGTWKQETMHVLKGGSQLAMTLFLFPYALILKRMTEKQVQYGMKQQKNMKPLSY